MHLKNKTERATFHTVSYVQEILLESSTLIYSRLIQIEMQTTVISALTYALAWECFVKTID